MVADAVAPSLPAGSLSMAPDEAPVPYHLHPQHGLATGGMSGDPENPRSFAGETLGKGDTVTPMESNHAEAGECRKVPAQPCQNMTETPEVAAGKQSKNTLKLKSLLLPKRNLERTREDIVERNKITLGRNTTKCGSYLKAHAPRQGTDDMTVCGE